MGVTASSYIWRIPVKNLNHYYLLYRILKVYVRLALFVFCRKVIINRPELLKTKGPLLLACNHPDSFLDSVILDTLFEQPIWSLARGDVFKNKTIAKLLTALKILPVYRTSEGVENLSENYKTFEACIDHFRQGHVVAIFSEGKCVNEWHLRPLKKGTARLAIKAWEENIPLQVLSVGLNYSSFERFGKNLFLNFGNSIQKDDIDITAPDGIRNQAFNALLKKELEQQVYEIPTNDKQQQAEKLSIQQPLAKKIVLAFPAIIGWLLHFPLFFPVKKIAWKYTKHNDHYDSAVVSVLLLLYPFYVAALTITGVVLTHSWLALALIVVLPFTAWAYVQLKKQI